MGDPNPNSNISHLPMTSLTHPMYQHFKLAQKIHTGEQIVRPEAHIIGSSNIETSNRPYRRHQPQFSYSKSVFTYPKQFCLHTIEYYSILKESYSQFILIITCILNHFKLFWATWSWPVNTSNRCKSNLLFLFVFISIRFELIRFPRNVLKVESFHDRGYILKVANINTSFHEIVKSHKG